MSAFRGRGKLVFRDPAENNRKVLDSSNYPLVPYSNRNGNSNGRMRLPNASGPTIVTK
jgi:hypothetical protein